VRGRVCGDCQAPSHALSGVYAASSSRLVKKNTVTAADDIAEFLAGRQR
jgi:hypothetical protein